MELKRTPLFPLYRESGAKVVEFGGWEMPVQFTSILQEHHAVRERVGLFDVSHMGEFEVTGRDARSFLQFLVTNDVSRLEPGMAMYSPMTDETGGCVDDLLLYCFSDEKFWVVVNAGNIEKDYAWFEQHRGQFQVSMSNRSPEIALLALQGPRAEQLLQGICDTDLSTVRYYRFVEGTVAGVRAVISRTGYTGEDGFELYVDADAVVGLWRSLTAAAIPYELALCGLGARDTLRLEARLPLYGHELSAEISPLEAGLGGFVKLEAAPFVGREALIAQKEAGVPRKTVGLRLVEKGIPRADYRVLRDGVDIGYVTSGTLSPTLKEPIGLALIQAASSAIGTRLEVDVRGKRVAAEVVKTPFYRRPTTT